jgi:DNA polymerase III delta prime subunit
MRGSAMNITDCRFVRLTNNIEIPVPKNCTPEEELALVAKYMAENDIAELEKEAQDLARAIEEGDMVSVDELLRILDADSEPSKKTA